MQARPGQDLTTQCRSSCRPKCGTRANDIYQVDTGPVAFPDLSQRHARHVDALSLAFVVFNAPHFADFVLEAPTRVGGEQVYHYSKIVSLAAVNRLYAVRS